MASKKASPMISIKEPSQLVLPFFLLTVFIHGVHPKIRHQALKRYQQIIVKNPKSQL